MRLGRGVQDGDIVRNKTARKSTLCMDGTSGLHKCAFVRIIYTGNMHMRELALQSVNTTIE